MLIYKRLCFIKKGEEWGKLICDLNLFITLAMNLFLLPAWDFITVNKPAMTVELQYINSPKKSY